MAATGTAVFKQVSTQTGSTLAGAFPQTPQGGTQDLDLIQVVGLGGSIILSVDYLGTVHKPGASTTNGTRLGQFQSRLTSSSTVAAIIADAFTNTSHQDIIQAVNIGGNIHYYLDYLGVAHGS